MKKPEIQPPKILDAIVDTVLAYRPEPKSTGSKKRTDKAAQITEKITKDKSG